MSLKDLGKVGLTRGFFNSEQDKIDHLNMYSGDPSGVFVALQGSLCLDIVNLQLYMNSDGSTGWVLVSNAALLGVLTSQGIRIIDKSYNNPSEPFQDIWTFVNAGSAFTIGSNEVPLVTYTYVRDGKRRKQVWLMKGVGVGSYGTGNSPLSNSNFILINSNDPNDNNHFRPDNIVLDDMGDYFATDPDVTNRIIDPSGSSQETLNRILEKKIKALDTAIDNLPTDLGLIDGVSLEAISLVTPVTTTPADTCSFTADSTGDIISEILINSDKWGSNIFDAMAIYLNDTLGRNVMHCIITNQTDGTKIFVKVISVAPVSTFYKLYLQVDANGAETFVKSNTSIVLNDILSFQFFPGEQNVTEFSTVTQVVATWVDGRDIVRTTIPFTNGTLVDNSILIHNLNIEFYLRETFIIPGLGSEYPSSATPGDLLSMGYIGLYNPSPNQIQANFVDSDNYTSGDTWYYIVEYVSITAASNVSTVSNFTANQNIDSTVATGIIITEAMVTSNYYNSDSNSPDYLVIVNPFSIGEFYLNGSPLVGTSVSISDISNSLLIWYPQNFDLSFMPPSPFSEVMTFRIQDTSSNVSNAATLTISGIDVSQISGDALFVGNSEGVIKTTIFCSTVPETGSLDLEYDTDSGFGSLTAFPVSITGGVDKAIIVSTNSSDLGADINTLSADTTYYFRLKRSVGVYTNTVTFKTAAATALPIDIGMVWRPSTNKFAFNITRESPSDNHVTNDTFSLDTLEGNHIHPVVAGTSLVISPTIKTYSLKESFSNIGSWEGQPSAATPYVLNMERVFDTPPPSLPGSDYADIRIPRIVRVYSIESQETMGVLWTQLLESFVTVKFEQGASINTAMRVEIAQNNFSQYYTNATLTIDMSESSSPATIDAHTLSYPNVILVEAFGTIREWVQTHPAGEFTYIRRITITHNSLATLVANFAVGDNESYTSGFTLN